MRIYPILLIAAAAMPGRALCVQQQGTELAPVSLSLRVNADGTLSDVGCGAKVAPELCPVLTRTVSHWQFAPGQRDSQPADIDVWLGLNLVAVKKGEGFSIQATHAKVYARAPSAATGEIKPETRALNPPQYPRDEMRRGIEAVVIMEVSPQPGSPHPVVGQTWVGGQPAREKNPFVKASREAVAKWELAEMPPEQLSTCVKIEFTVDKPGSPNPQSDTAPCVQKFKDGFVLPQLLTDPLTASF